jgi:hypothetical protein
VCVSGIGIISVFFDVDPASQGNPLFAFLDNSKAPLDLSTLFPIDIALYSLIHGYVGTNTVPNCERGVCWYFLGSPQPIS